MGHTKETANLKLSQFITHDKPTYLGDYNSDMKKIDDGFLSLSNRVKKNEDDIAGLQKDCKEVKDYLSTGDFLRKSDIGNTVLRMSKVTAFQFTGSMSPVPAFNPTSPFSSQVVATSVNLIGSPVPDNIFYETGVEGGKAFIKITKPGFYLFKLNVTGTPDNALIGLWNEKPPEIISSRIEGSVALPIRLEKPTETTSPADAYRNATTEMMFISQSVVSGGTLNKYGMIMYNYKNMTVNPLYATLQIVRLGDWT